MGSILKEILTLIGFIEEEEVMGSYFYYFDPNVE